MTPEEMMQDVQARLRSGMDRNAVFPEDDWAELFTPAALNRFAPRRGEAGDPVPVLEVHYSAADGKPAVALMLLAAEGFHDWQTRRALLRAIGGRCADQGWQVVALVFASAAWMRTFSMEEAAQRGDRQIETYDDKEEILMVHGMTLDDRTRLASARVLRDSHGRIRAVRPWTLFPTQAEGARLTSSFLCAAWEGYAAAWLARKATQN